MKRGRRLSEEGEYIRCARVLAPLNRSTAEGFRRFAKSGPRGRVIEVTNLNDAGPEGFRQACTAEGPRTLVFHVGGAIGTLPIYCSTAARNLAIALSH